nr:hypothetical protein OG461_24915 [Streptomyces sp. NBC_00995]
MISEPEMAGEFGEAAGGEVLAGAGSRPGDDRPPRLPGPRPRWWWALGGALVASLVWGTVLFADGSRDTTPDLHGYRLDRDPCATVRLKSIGAAIAPRGPEDRFEEEMLRHAALDRARCSIPLRSENGQQRPDEGWSLGYVVRVEIALHKKTDPGPEFEAGRNATELGVDPDTEVEVVPELGDKAYLLSLESGEQELRVREGGAVLSLRLSCDARYESDGQPPTDAAELPDLAPHKAAMISDMRDLMTTLKS